MSQTPMVLVALALGVAAVSVTPAAGQVISGGGETLVLGGSGGNPPVPVKTNFGFRIVKDGDQVDGRFECLALAPSAPSGPGSGTFTENIMYVTGRVTSVSQLTSDGAMFSGTATVTGLGAGVNLPFNCEVQNVTGTPVASKPNASGVTVGGPGARMTLVVSGLTFDEIVTQGGISMTPLKRKRK
jgi:hypothetical protein